MTESKNLSGGERASHWALTKGGMKAAWPICIGATYPWDLPLGFWPKKGDLAFWILPSCRLWYLLEARSSSIHMPYVPAPLILSYSAKTPPVSPKATTWPRFMSMQRLHSERTVAKE